MIIVVIFEWCDYRQFFFSLLCTLFHSKHVFSIYFERILDVQKTAKKKSPQKQSWKLLFNNILDSCSTVIKAKKLMLAQYF